MLVKRFKERLTYCLSLYPFFLPLFVYCFRITIGFYFRLFSNGLNLDNFLLQKCIPFFHPVIHVFLWIVDTSFSFITVLFLFLVLLFVFLLQCSSFFSLFLGVHSLIQSKSECKGALFLKTSSWHLLSTSSVAPLT